jgi:hypothetical protein
VTEDALASVLTDMQVANVLIAAGQTLGETGKAAQPSVLDEAVVRLENTAHAIERSLPAGLTTGVEPGRFGFVGDVTIAKAPQSADLPSAIESFKHRCNETLTVLVNEAETVVTGVITALSKLDKDRVLAALSKLGEQIPALPEIGRLFRWGVNKLRAAITSLIHLLGTEALAGIKACVGKIWEEVKEGKYISQTLQWAFGVETTRSHIDDILHASGLQQESLDKGSNDVSGLAVSFKENMAIARGLTSGLTLATTVLALTPLAGPQLALLAGSGYAVVLGGRRADRAGLRRLRPYSPARAWCP